VSRAIRFAPLALLVLILAALVWRLATPADTNVHSALEGKPLPAFNLPAIIPGKPDESLFIKAVRYTDTDLQMPPADKKLPDNAIRDLEEWVRMGARARQA